MGSATFLLLLLLGATEAMVPSPCQGDPASRCRDMATATRCGWQEQCQDLWDSLALGNVAEGGDTADGDGVAQGKKLRCSLCTRALKRIQKLAGDDPDEAAVAAALQKGCRVLGRTFGKLCQKLLNKYKDQISEELQNGDTPQDICTAMGICRS